MNKLYGILENFIEQKGISRLFVRCWDFMCVQELECAQNVESQNCIAVLLLEDSNFIAPLLHQPLQLGFKESNVVVALKLEGVCNAFRAEILQIDEDNLFAQLTLQVKEAENGVIYALCDLDFIKRNGLRVGDFVFWHIPESEIMLFFDTEKMQPKD
ncbi:molybdate ABC transporter [Helicobacter sp. MIT 05-5294]|uniref:molybdate ABC transporter n=1 Tax=Helicobacter sp. MIT 05-5294 TaxID=1548150 RepID=UPI000B2A19FB|nr:molybdate ABC transporter [Helicobacter sp. MIT 05-5294]TLD88162.1 molybdate ABC transporter [Helicobacter sp. MIT 05-5294]